MNLASCTLDGCVKVYTSRVDSVATETTKLLGGLATSASKFSNNGFFFKFWCLFIQTISPGVLTFGSIVTYTRGAPSGGS